jgi:hypothetical protein
LAIPAHTFPKTCTLELPENVAFFIDDVDRSFVVDGEADSTAFHILPAFVGRVACYLESVRVTFAFKCIHLTVVPESKVFEAAFNFFPLGALSQV